PGKCQRSMLLTPTGKVVSCMWLYMINETDFLLVSEHATRQALEDGLKKLLIRTKAEVVDDSHDFVAIVSDEEPQVAEDVFCITLEEGHGSEKVNLFLVADRENFVPNKQD